MKLILSLLCFFNLLILDAHTQSMAQNLGNSDAPVEISADGTLEWLQNKNQYVANGNVIAKQGDVTIYADQLIADYKDNETTGNVEITQITALGNVRIENTDSKAQGDKAVYDVNTTQATLTGENLKLTTPDQVITSTKSMTYNSTKGTAEAIGNAKIISDGNTLTAPTIQATFKKNKTGKQVLNRADATGGVTIKTPDEILKGNKGVYYASNETAQISGNVKIVRGPNTLEGARAEVNLKTNISKMFGAPENGKRVTGVFFPNSNKSGSSPKE